MKITVGKLKPMACAAFIASACASIPCLANDEIPHWEILNDISTITWTADYGGKPVTGTFPAFTGDITFDPKHLDVSHAVITIETGKIKSDDHDAQENLPTNDWFASTEFPKATFETKEFKQVKGNAFEATGNLTVRDKSEPVTLPFIAKFYDDNDSSPPTHYVRIEGETTIKRLPLDVGQSNWLQTDTVADDVKIILRLEAKQVVP